MFHNFFKFVLAALALWIAVANGAPQTIVIDKNNTLVTGPGPATGDLNVPTTSQCVPNAPTGLDASCWDVLDMSDYIDNWWTANGTSCGDLGFAQCFLKQNNYPGLTCDIITEDTCGPPDTNGKWDTPQQFYTLWNIYAVHQYFSQYYQAITNAQASALGKVGDIVLQVNPPHETVVDGKLISIMISASFGLFGVAKEALSIATEKMIFVGVSALAGGSSQILNYLTTENTNNYEQETIQIADTQSKLTDMILDYQQGIASLIQSVQGDVGKFMLLCSRGGFNQRMTSSLPEEQSSILDQLTQYILGVALTANDIVVNVSPNTNIMDVAASDKDKIDNNHITCTGFDNYGACGAFWYDASTDTTYTLENLKSLHDNHYSDLTHKIWDNGWATPASLYTGRTDCGDQAPHLDDNGILQCAAGVTRCIAANQQFDVQQAVDHPPATVQEFTNCPNSDNFAHIEVAYTRSGRRGQVYMPCSYLGPELSNELVVLGGSGSTGGCNY